MKVMHANALRALACGLMMAVVTFTSVVADPLGAPTGAVVLTIAGQIQNSNADQGQAAFDLAMLEALPAQSFETTTPWTDGKQKFTGVALKDLLATLGASGARAHAVATNQYEVTFPLSDVTDHGGIIAYRQNDAALPADKGPLWIVFPYDNDPKLLEDRFQSASIWNLASLTIN